MTVRPDYAIRMTSTVTEEDRLTLALEEFPMPEPGEDEVLIRVEASPINPSDLGVMLSVTDSNAYETGSDALPSASAPVPEKLRGFVAARKGRPIPVGNEGAGTVVAAGASPEAQALIGKVVALAGGGFYATYRTACATDCMVLPEDHSAEEGASSFVNPLTALGMVGTMRAEGYKALVHTAAASNLGQMLVKLCAEEEIGLINIVRSDAQVELLRSLGAKHAYDMTADDFAEKLTDAIAEEEAYLGFDAIGGGRLANQILTAMEAAAVRTNPATGPYGSTQMKQVYIYGGLSTAPTELTRGFGMKWNVGGWLLTYYLQQAGAGEAAKMRARVAAGLRSTFASSYTRHISLTEAVHPDMIAEYNRRATGEKFLVTPQA